MTIIGVDIGQKRDPTAIAVVEVDRRPVDPSEGRRSRWEFHFVVRYLRRLPLMTPYPQISRRLAEICQRVEDRMGKRPYVYVDATGVGQPIVDVLKDSSSSRVSIWSVYFTHGEQRNEKRKERTVTLGKARLVSRLQALLQTGRIHLPKDHPEADALARELLDYEIRIGENAREKFGAFRVGTHDDLVTALGLAVQQDPGVTVYPGKEYYHL